MGAGLTIEYQEHADILLIAKCPSYIGQNEDEIDDLVCARTNVDTGEIEYIEIVFFESRIKAADKVVLPIDATLKTANPEVQTESAQPHSGDKRLTIRYDRGGDALTLEQCPPHPGQYSREICEDVTARLNAGTGEIESLEIRCFKARTENDGEIILPVNATLRPAKHTVAAD